jgi:hypothetical protein
MASYYITEPKQFSREKTMPLEVTTLHTDEPSISGASWGAIWVGAAASIAVTFAVIAFGTGLGLSVVSPWESSGVSATTFKIGSGIFLIVIAMFSSSIGGFLAGRLRTRWIGVKSDEVYFRDTAHGFASWAVATVVGFTLLAAPATSLIGSAASGLGQAGASATEPYTDLLLRPAAGTTQPRQQDGSAADTRAEFGRLLMPTQSGGTVSADDRSYIARVVASRTGLSQADADKRVNDVLTKAKSDVDAARKAAAQLAFWLTASLLIGAFCASLAATEGGAIRDGTWRLQRSN